MFTLSVTLSVKDLYEIFHGEVLSLVFKIYNATVCCRLLYANETIKQKCNNPL